MRKPWLSPEVTSKDVHEVVAVVPLSGELGVDQLVVLGVDVVLDWEVLVGHTVHTFDDVALGRLQLVLTIVVTSEVVGDHQGVVDVGRGDDDNQGDVKGVDGITSEDGTGDVLGEPGDGTKVVVLDNLDRETGSAEADGGRGDQCHTCKN